MRAWMLTVLIAAMALAGCAESDPVPDEDGPEAPSPAVPDGVAVYGPDADGVRAAMGDVTGEAVYLPTGYPGPEPNMGITSSGAIFVSASAGSFGSGVIRSTDNGTSWDVVHSHDALDTDPMLWVDPWTDCVYHAPMFPILLGATLYESCDDGASWTPIHSQNMGRGVYDHQKLATALPGPDAPPGVGVLHPTSFIICYNALAYTNCAVSFDGGVTWPHDGPIWQGAAEAGEEAGAECAGQQSHPTGAPDGTIVVAKAWGCDEPWVFVSTDNGITWEQRAGPQGVGADTLDPEIAFSDDGAMYMLWQSRPDESHAYLARSDDMGQTWSGPWNVTPPGMNSTIFAALHAGTPGRVAMAFHATNHTGAPVEVPDDAVWHTYVVTSEDADTEAPTFTSRRVQDDPVQVGSICKGNRGCHDGNRNLLDFIDGAIAPDGTFYAVVADGCVGSCADGSEQTMENSRSREASLVRLDGWNLFVDAAPS